MNQPEFASKEFSLEDRVLLARASSRLEAEITSGAPANDIELNTAIEFLRVSRMPANAEFARSVAAAHQPEGPRPAVCIGLVPGAFYREHANTGADGAHVVRILAALGHRAELIPVSSFGSLADNARIINDWIQQQGAPVVLISLSKGASDLKTALHKLGSVGVPQCRVVAWISLSGISTGTPLVDWLRRRPWRWCGVWLLLRLRGQRITVLKELRHGTGAPLASWPDFPLNLQIVHVHGFPLQRHLKHPWAAKAYQRLTRLGPNDGGGVLLADVARWPGIVVPLWGVDHYMQPTPDITARLSRVFQIVLERCA